MTWTILRVVTHVEAARSIEAAADTLRADIVLPSAVRWVRRRLRLIRATVLLAVTLNLPDLVGVDAHLPAVQAAYTDRALVLLRTRAAADPPAWPRPLGFGPQGPMRDATRRAPLQAMGPDATGSSARGSRLTARPRSRRDDAAD